MTVVYKRTNEENSFECHECKTVWRDSWLEENQRGWCPACHVENIPTEMVKLPAVTMRPFSKELRQYLTELHA